MKSNTKIIDFILNSQYEDFDQTIILQAKKCLLDTLAVSIMGSQTKLSKIIDNFAKSFYQGEDSSSLVHHTKMSQLGALFVSAMSIDAFDMHDGHILTKGHTGVSVIPASLLIHNRQNLSGKEVLTNIIIAYEIALRAGIALHSTALDYHTSGAWNSLGVCAIACRVLKLNKEQTQHALGICEFYAPRSQMMKVIDTPTMLKDGSGFGAFVGLKSALLAQAGFSGAPSLILETKQTQSYWQDLGNNFEILNQYFKPYPVCRWAQPSIEAANHLVKQQAFDISDIDSVIVETFHEATRLNNNIPTNTEQAQYALKYPTVLSLAQKDIVKTIISENFKLDQSTSTLFDKTTIIENDSYNQQFPQKRFAHITLKTKDGQHYQSGVKEAIWGENTPPTYEEIKQKFYTLNKEIMPDNQLQQIEKCIVALEEINDISTLREYI